MIEKVNQIELIFLFDGSVDAFEPYHRLARKIAEKFNGEIYDSELE